MKKWLGIALLVLAAFWVLSSPTSAAERLRAGLGGLGEAGQQVTLFIENATKGPQPGGTG